MDIFIVGYPRSGNTWLGQLMSDILDGVWVSGGVIYPSRFAANQSMRVHKSHALASEGPTPGQTILLCRHPFDTAVSIMHYRHFKSISEALTLMANVHDPSRDLYGRYEQFYTDWLKKGFRVEVRYEDLHRDPAMGIKRLANAFGFAPSLEQCQAVANRHTIEKDRAHFNDPHAFRHGMVGDYHSEFSPEDIELGKKLFGNIIGKLGYDGR